jgi:hypothetical protein
LLKFFIKIIAFITAAIWTLYLGIKKVLLFKSLVGYRVEIFNVTEVQEVHEFFSVLLGFSLSLFSPYAFFQVPYPVLRKIGS